jgi:putative FmdB family regulatory protein
MPSYEFICRDCGAPYEARLSMSAYASGEGRRCPACGSANVERHFTEVSVLTSSRCGSGGGSSSCGGGSGFT